MSGDPVLDAFRQTWEPYRKPVDLRYVDTDNFRVGWPKPTLYREHETIHVLANAVDQALRDLAHAQATIAAVRARIDEADGRLTSRHYPAVVSTADLRAALGAADPGPDQADGECRHLNCHPVDGDTWWCSDCKTDFEVPS